MLVQRALDLDRIPFLPAAVDHVLLAIDEIEIPVLVEVAEVAGVHPTVAPGARAGLGVVPIRALPRRQPDGDLADLPPGPLVTVVVYDANRCARHRLAHRSRASQELTRRHRARAAAPPRQAGAVAERPAGG